MYYCNVYGRKTDELFNFKLITEQSFHHVAKQDQSSNILLSAYSFSEGFS